MAVKKNSKKEARGGGTESIRSYLRKILFLEARPRRVGRIPEVLK
jgi:hypothetical protein